MQEARMPESALPKSLLVTKGAAKARTVPNKYFTLPPERPAPKPTRIILIRHAQSGHNAEGVCQGSSDETGLSEQGRAEAERTREALADEQIDVVCSSPLRRALETARLLFPGREVIPLPLATERGFGQWQGRRWEDLEREHPETFAQYKQTRELLVPGAERLREYQERCMKLAEGLVLSNPGRTIALVTHGGIIRGVTAFVAGKRKVLTAERARNCSITVLEYDRLLKSYEVVKYSDAGHLPKPALD